MIDYKFIGWCGDGIHDKVWICIQLSGDRWHGKFLTVWGRRGKTLQSKQIETNSHEIDKLIRSKERKYAEIPQDKLHEVYPEFKEDLEKTTAWALLKV
jgi:hypothetical protein